MCFDDCQSTPDQEFELHRDIDGTFEYPIK